MLVYSTWLVLSLKTLAWKFNGDGAPDFQADDSIKRKIKTMSYDAPQ